MDEGGLESLLRVLGAALLGLGCIALLTAAGRLRFVVTEFASSPRRLLGALLFWAVLSVCVFFPAVTPGQAEDLDLTELWFPSLFLGHLLLGGFLVAWWSLREPQSAGEFLRLEPLLAADLERGLWYGTMGWVVTIVSTAVASGVFTLASGADAAAAASEVPPIMVWMAGLPVWKKLCIVAVAMTVEEAFFRGFLQVRIGWIPSSILFALSHASYGLPSLMFSVFVISLVIGWSMRQTGRLLPCIVAHGVFDAIQLLVILPWAVRMLQS